MRLEKRKVFGSEFVVALCESEEESLIIDTLGNNFKDRENIPISGEIRLSNGFEEHYLLLKPLKESSNNSKQKILEEALKSLDQIHIHHTEQYLLNDVIKELEKIKSML
jgi:hypothetical protein